MDPASVVGLVAACGSLTKQCASVATTLHGLIETYKHAELAMISIAEECSTIQYAWRKIAEWAEGNLHRVDDFEELGERLQRSIYCGELVMSALEEEVMVVTSNSNNFKRRIGVVWNSGIFVEHQARLRGQVGALQLLIQILNLPLKQDRIEVLSVKDSVFSDAEESALSIVPSDRSTRYSFEGNRLSFQSDAGDIRYIQFSFEDALFTSHVYKRNYRFPMMKAQPQSQLQLDSEQASQASTGKPVVQISTQGLTEGAFEFNLEPHAGEHADLFGEWTTEPTAAPSSNDVHQYDVPELTTSSAAHTGSIVIDPNNSNIDSVSSHYPDDIISFYPKSNFASFNPGQRTKSPTMPQIPDMRDIGTAIGTENEIPNPYTPPARDVRANKRNLSRALMLANSAVLLDNSQSFQHAITKYQSACKMLELVIECTSTEDDRRKVRAIQTTYYNRVSELVWIAGASKS